MAEEHRSYDPSLFEPISAVEGRHFWFCARRRAVSAMIRQITRDLSPGYRVLEVGCGTGKMLEILRENCSAGRVVGLDLFREGLSTRGGAWTAPFVQGDVHSLPFATSRFQVICLLDVLEHLPNDLQVLRELHRLLAPQGKLLLTVPAHPALWSYFDEASGHCRRYNPSELQGKLANGGFRVEYLTQFLAALFPLVWFGRRIRTLIGQRGRAGHPDGARALASQELRILPVANELLTLLLASELPLLARRRRLPIGTSLLAIASRDS